MFKADLPGSFHALHYNFGHEFQNWKIGVTFHQKNIGLREKSCAHF